MGRVLSRFVGEIVDAQWHLRRLTGLEAGFLTDSHARARRQTEK